MLDCDFLDRRDGWLPWFRCSAKVHRRHRFFCLTNYRQQKQKDMKFKRVQPINWNALWVVEEEDSDFMY